MISHQQLTMGIKHAGSDTAFLLELEISESQKYTNMAPKTFRDSFP